MAHLRPKIVKLAKIIGGVSGMTVKIDENTPEYYSMAEYVTDDQADIAIAAGLRTERTAEYLAKKVGKTVEEIMPDLDRLHADLRTRHHGDDGQQPGTAPRTPRGWQSL